MTNSTENISIVIITQVFTLVYLWLKDYYFKIKLEKDKIKKQLTPIDRSELFIKLTRICGEIKNDLHANGVFIAYFHNGDYYKNGLSIDKFTVVAEDYDVNVNGGYIEKYRNITINYINYLYHRLLTDGRCYKENIPNLIMLDNSYKRDCQDRNVTSTYSFLIKDEYEKPIGFVSIEYCYNFNFKKEYESCIWKHQLSTSRNIKDITNYNCN